MGQGKICNSLEEAKTEWVKIDWNKCRIKEGQIFGKLTTLYRTLNDKNGYGKHTNIVCKCSCGENYVKIDAGSLKRGCVISCGCFHKQQMAIKKTHNLVGKKFGLLTVIKRADNIGTDASWECKCECGNYKIIRGYSLLAGSTNSCGCIGKSLGERKISDILTKNSIPFETEKTFEGCKDINKLPFDFYVDNNYVIEFDGEQHFNARHTGFFTSEVVNKIKEHDNIKNCFCKENNIPIIRIPYMIYNELSIKDLLLETSSYILK